MPRWLLCRSNAKRALRNGATVSRNGEVPTCSLGLPIELPNVQQWLKKERRTWVWVGQFGDEPAVYKLYRKREPWHTLRCALTCYRVEREYRIHQHLTSLNVRCPKSLGWTRGYCSVHGYFELLVTRQVSNAVALDTFIKNGHQPDVAPLFALARSMHEAGVCSQVLISRNVLVVDLGHKLHFMLIDFPRAHIFPGGVVGTRVPKVDLIMLLQDLTRLGVPLATSTLIDYGMTHEEARTLLATTRRGKGKFTSRLADVECRIHHMLAHVRVGGRTNLSR